MTTLAPFTRFCAAALVSTLLAVAIAGAARADQPAATGAVAPKHGAWQGFAFGDSDRTFAVADKPDDSKAVVFVFGARTSLLIARANWGLQVGASVPVLLTIDDTTYRGTAQATDTDQVVLSGISDEVVTRLSQAKYACLSLNQGTFVWALDLDGYNASVADAWRLSRLNS